MKSSRKVVTRAPYRVVGLIACNWLQVPPVEYESQLEKRFVQKCLLIPNLRRIVHQPFQIEYGNELEKRYTPDFLIELCNDQKFVIEVKPNRFISKYENLFDQASEILSLRNYSFHVVSESHIDIANQPEAIQYVLRYARSSFATEIIDKVIEFTRSMQKSESIRSICNATGASPFVIFHLLGRCKLQFENEISTSLDTLISTSNLKDSKENVLISDWLNTSKWTSDTRIFANAIKDRSAI